MDSKFFEKKMLRFLLLLVLTIAFPSFAKEGLSAQQWLQSMSHALQSQQFKMSLIHVQAEHIVPLIYIHGHVKNKDIAFLEHLNGPPKNAVRVNDKVTFIEHDVKPYSVNSQRIQGVWPAIFAKNINQLQLGYEFILGGRSRIAGRPGQLVRIMPKEDDRYSHLVWIDMQNYLPLRYEMVTNNKQILEQTMVVELSLLPKSPSLLNEIESQHWPVAIKPTSEAKGDNWQFSYLPIGFKVTHKDHHRLLGSNNTVEYTALTDGLINVSVYVNHFGKVRLPEEVIIRNGLSMATVQKSNVEVVVVGKMPPQILTQIANGLQMEK